MQGPRLLRGRRDRDAREHAEVEQAALGGCEEARIHGVARLEGNLLEDQRTPGTLGAADLGGAGQHALALDDAQHDHQVVAGRLELRLHAYGRIAEGEIAIPQPDHGLEHGVLVVGGSGLEANEWRQLLRRERGAFEADAAHVRRRTFADRDDDRDPAGSLVDLRQVHLGREVVAPPVCVAQRLGCLARGHEQLAGAARQLQELRIREDPGAREADVPGFQARTGLGAEDQGTLAVRAAGLDAGLDGGAQIAARPQLLQDAGVSLFERLPFEQRLVDLTGHIRGIGHALDPPGEARARPHTEHGHVVLEPGARLGLDVALPS